MKSKLMLLTATILFCSCKQNAQTAELYPNKGEDIATNTEIINNQTIAPMEKMNIYGFKVTDLSGKEFDFSSLKGKKILIVNTASKCGLTKQYKELEQLYKDYKGSGLEIVGFPANNFGGQEPGTDAEIASFCSKNYGVSFLMMSKISVVGDNMHPMYQFLTQKSKNGLQDSEVGWNFQKYLINENGELERVVSPQVSPTDEVIVSWIKG